MAVLTALNLNTAEFCTGKVLIPGDKISPKLPDQIVSIVDVCEAAHCGPFNS